MPKPDPNFSKPADRINLILDSGAFSAWRLGKEINLKAYCDYIERNRDWIAHYVSLDYINPADPETAAKVSFDNWLYMRKRGLHPLPVLHVGEDISWLYRMLDAGCDYICLSASSIAARSAADDWYALVWSHLVNKDGLPVIKAHSLGEGRSKPLKLFPWASSDSTSWIYTAQRTGQLQLTPTSRVSIRNDGGGSKSSPALHGLSDLDKAELERFMDEKGVDLASFDYAGKAPWVMRAYMMVLYYQNLEREVRAAQPIRFRPRGFFKQEGDHAGIIIPPFNLHLVIQGKNMTWMLPTYARHYSMLISYFYITVPNFNMETKGGIDFSFRDWVHDPLVYSSQFSQTYGKTIWEIMEKYTNAKQ